MEVATKDEKSRLWYVFWDDFYTQNKGMSVLKEHLHLFDPTKGTAMCYKPVPTRNDLEKFLSDLKLTSGCLKKYFDSRTIDLLYYRLDYPQYYNTTHKLIRSGVGQKLSLVPSTNLSSVLFQFEIDTEIDTTVKATIWGTFVILLKESLV